MQVCEQCALLVNRWAQFKVDLEAQANAKTYALVCCCVVVRAAGCALVLATLLQRRVEVVGERWTGVLFLHSSSMTDPVFSCIFSRWPKFFLLPRLRHQQNRTLAMPSTIPLPMTRLLHLASGPFRWLLGEATVRRGGSRVRG